MVELINNDVVESVYLERLQVALEGLDARENNISRDVAFIPREHCERAAWANAPIDIPGLSQYLLAMSDEEHPLETWTSRVKSSKPRLT
ncbi:unannotated protein [freshwater metagenome]|uniref:Unannotated protein n=1 Tax=freshwater metagenome TaxID=449393 RepID=A0A6J6YHB8_9ZZZZ